ncbi:MAG TPA: iron-sulfur cluster repair di-iron protein [Candidatus Sulfotelmatobacter sp.]|nr:iron-sulfur cluster repair di-iron protein [Candidatus Sulfotelmatobacter sp.]HWI59660.1 iron-sulfur cluster repair di-iron protein [Bacillota bacterium]
MTTETTIGEIVRANPASSRIFEHLGIDYCCGGKKSLAEVCRTKGLDASTVVAMLSAIDTLPGEAQVYPDAMTLTQLCDHIQQAHHAYLREELPRLDFMTQKVLAVHGEHEPRLRQLRKAFEAFNAEMTAHTNEEDEVVFPAIRSLEAGQTEEPSALPAALAKLERDHDGAGALLEQFKALTDSYTPPDWACNTFRALYAALAHLEKDTHQHVSKENSVLFPKALAAATAALEATRQPVRR